MKIAAAVLIALWLTPMAARSSVQGLELAAERLGSVSFAVSCKPQERGAFNRGVALLHDFWYDEASAQFARILTADPACAMAYWGLAMSGFHQIWEQPDASAMKAGWHALQSAQARPAKTARERAYVAALAEFFRPGASSFQPRIEAYAAAMGRLYARYPKDVDAGTFYALALLAAEAPDDTTLNSPHRAMAVLVPLDRNFPDHPGVVHYIIHACDTPSLAADGLAAARHYGEIAPSGPHAVHMPGHIFSRLGLWQEDIDANLASVAASHAAEARHESGGMDQFHSEDFLVYAYLQSGQEERARAIAAEAAAAIQHYQDMPAMAPQRYMVGMFPYYRAKLPIFIALEERDWPAAMALVAEPGAPPETQTQVYWAHAIAAGHLRDGQAAQAAFAAHEALMDDVRKGEHAYLARSTGAQVRSEEMQSWLAFATGDAAAAEHHMRAAAELQDKVGQGEVDIPAREMLADILLESGQPQAALVEYQRALKLSPNRLNGLFNASRAAEAAGDPAGALNYDRQLMASTDGGAHSARPEFNQVKAALMAAHTQ